MSDLPFPPGPSAFNEQSAAADSVTLLLPHANVRSGDHALIAGSLRPRRDLPIYCNPVAIFFAVWILMLACLCVHVSYVIYPYFATPLLIFAVSAGSLLLGLFAFTAVAEPAGAQDKPVLYFLDVTTLRRLNLLFCLLALLLIAFNWATSGPPPALGDPGTYLTYGKLRQIFFPLVESIAVNATLDPSRLRRYLFITFAFGVLVLHVARGLLLVTFLQMFFLFSLRTGLTKRRQYLLSLATFAVAVAGMTIFGNLRTAHDIFIEFLQIRDTYADWPMAFLWVVSYISIPFSNLCWMVAHPAAHGPTFAFLYPLLPGFIAPRDPYADTYNSLNLIDNASTYLQSFALDFSYVGIYFANLFLGIVCGWMMVRDSRKHILVLPILLTFLSFIFFTNMFFNLAAIIQILIQLFVQNRCFSWQRPGSAHSF
jgi:hypothetical protein